MCVYIYIYIEREMSTVPCFHVAGRSTHPRIHTMIIIDITIISSIMIICIIIMISIYISIIIIIIIIIIMYITLYIPQGGGV